MDTYIETRLVALNSQDAIKFNSSYLSDVEFKTNGIVIYDSDIVNIEVSLLHAEIPASFYNINYTNNTLVYSIGAGLQTIVTIPVGNYNSTSLFSQIYTLTSNSLTFTLSKITGKITITNLANNFTIYGTGTINRVLGFELNTNYTSTSFSLTAPYVLNLLGITKISITSNEINTLNYSSNLGNTSLLQTLANDVQPYGIIIYENKSNVKNLIKVRDINKIDIQLRDQYYNLINFNNCDWSILLCFYITRKLIVSQDNGNLDLINISKINNTIKPTNQIQDNIKEKQKEPSSKNLEDLNFLTN